MNNQYLITDETSAKYFNRTTRGITRKFIDNLLSELISLKPNTVLDIGCGTGYITNIMSHELDSTVIGCDMDINRISFARDNLAQEVIIGDIMHLPFKDNSFDVVVASEIIEHILSPRIALNEIRRVSKKFILITVPNEPYFRIANVCRAKNLKSFGNPPDHINHYNKKSLDRLLVKYFKMYEIRKNAVFWLIAKIEKN